MDLTPIPAGNDVLVSAQGTASSQDYLSAAAGGGFGVTWSWFCGGFGWRIYGQRYAADGTALGSEFQIKRTPDLVFGGHSAMQPTSSFSVAGLNRRSRRR